MSDKFRRIKSPIPVKSFLDGMDPIERSIVGCLADLKDFYTKRRLIMQSHFPTFKVREYSVQSQKMVEAIQDKYREYCKHYIYDSLLQLARPWNCRYPLVKMQGNIGELAYYYSYASNAFTTVSFFDKAYSQLPHLLVNGTCTNRSAHQAFFPSHNISEVCDALIAFINNPDISIKDLMEIVKGPDFATGGCVSGDFTKIYTTGKGMICQEGCYEILKDGRGEYLHITQIPIGIYCEGRINVDYWSSQGLREGRQVDVEYTFSWQFPFIELKVYPKTISMDCLMKNLYRNHLLRRTIYVNMTLQTEEGVRRCNLKQLLQFYIDQQRRIGLSDFQIIEKLNLLKSTYGDERRTKIGDSRAYFKKCSSGC